MRIGEGRKMVQERAVNGAGAVEHSIKEAGREMGENSELCDRDYIIAVDKEMSRVWARLIESKM